MAGGAVGGIEGSGGKMMEPSGEAMGDKTAAVVEVELVVADE